MANDAKLGMGTVFKRNSVSVPGVESISPLSRNKEKIDSTNFGSNGRQYIQGMESYDDLNISIQFNPAETTHAGLLADYAAGTEQTFSLVYPFGSARTASFTGKVVKCEETTGLNDKMMLNVTIAITTSSVAYS